MKHDDLKFLQSAVENSRKSMDEGNFPAGAVVVMDGKEISSAVSSPYPNLLHPDSKAVLQAFEKYGLLKNATLYIGIQSCLMCTSMAYWAGIRRIVYAVPKAKLSGDYYETPRDTTDLFAAFNEKIEFIHMPELEAEALTIIRQWEKNILQK